MSELGIACKDPEMLLRRGVLISGVTTAPEGEVSREPGAVMPDLSTLRRLGLGGLAELEPWLATADTPVGNTVELISADWPEVREFVTAHTNPRVDPTLCLPGELTTTRNKRNRELYTGLHLDNHERRVAAERHLSTRRIGLNMGLTDNNGKRIENRSGSRWLLIGSLSALAITVALGEDPDTHIPTTLDVRKYVAEHGAKGREPLQLLWVLIGSNQGYIAGTEATIHDGSTHDPGKPGGLGKGSFIHFWLGAPATVGHFGSLV